MKRTPGFNVSLYQRSKEAIAQGALTNSKRPECFVKGVYPTHLVKGRGCNVWDAQGNQYVDFICGLGSNLLGYANHEIGVVVTDAFHKGATLSLGTPIELAAAEKVKELFPFIERVKFLKTGSDACSAAIRIARGKTGKDRIVSQDYHGWHDDFVSLTPPAIGIPKRDHITRLEKLEFLNESNIAAVIIEPIVTDISDERIKWLRELREACTKAGVLLIFDEVITGFRFPKFSVANYYGITPDLICLGKGIANGLPLSAVGGPTSIMEGSEYFVSSTFAGETLSLASALKTMTLLQTKYSLDELWEKGALFIKEFNQRANEVVQIEGYPTRGVLKGDPLVKALFMQEACKAGILFGPSWFFNFHHIDFMDTVLNSVSDICMMIKTGKVRLEGELPASPFAQRMREKQI